MMTHLLSRLTLIKESPLPLQATSVGLKKTTGSQVIPALTPSTVWQVMISSLAWAVLIS